MVDVRAFLSVLREHGLMAKPSKCEWSMCHVEYLGHIVGSGLVAVPQMRVKAMSEFAQPVSKKDMRAFLGAIGYYRKFNPQFSRFSLLRHAILRQGGSCGALRWWRPSERSG